jgi:NADP-dependent 3-hydroxy acid dehydrogenase YdfG
VGLKQIADSFGKEFHPEGVRVLSVFVGRTATPMQERIFEQEGRQYEPEHLLELSDIATVIANALRLAQSPEVTEIDIRPMMKT